LGVEASFGELEEVVEEGGVVDEGAGLSEYELDLVGTEEECSVVVKRMDDSF